MNNFTKSITDNEIRELFSSQSKRHEEITAAIAGYNLNGYPTSACNIMEHSELNRLAAGNGMENPDYVTNHAEVYKRAQLAIGADFNDQWIPDNPLTMGYQGYDSDFHVSGATTGKEEIIVDGMLIEEPEDVVEHMERFAFPRLQERIDNFDKEKCIRNMATYHIFAPIICMKM